MKGEGGQVFKAEDLGGKILELVRTEREVDEVREATDPGRKPFELVLAKPEATKVVKSEQGVRERV
jgi:hypothetical protein